MAWTLPGALFFAAIGIALCILTLAEIWRPSTARRGFLGLSTTRGDRFFMSLLTSAFIHVAWLGLTDLPVWWVSVMCAGLLGAVMRWG
jgi:predicted small integral membrane protein